MHKRTAIMIAVAAVSFLSVSIGVGQNDAPAVSPNKIIEGQQDQGKETVTPSVTASAAPKYTPLLPNFPTKPATNTTKEVFWSA